MRKAFEKYEPSLMKSPNYGQEVVESWATGQILSLAAKEGNLGGSSGTDVTSQQIYDGLCKFKEETLGGLVPPLTFTKGKAHQVNRWFWMATRHASSPRPMA